MLLFKTKRLERLEREVVMLEDLFAQTLQRIDKLEQARWGLKVDGTPKAKPGRKAKDERIS
jgi:uncharacterized protein involved in exopolysaccharide biosynthesis